MMNRLLWVILMWIPAATAQIVPPSAYIGTGPHELHKADETVKVKVRDALAIPQRVNSCGEYFLVLPDSDDGHGPYIVVDMTRLLPELPDTEFVVGFEKNQLRVRIDKKLKVPQAEIVNVPKDRDNPSGLMIIIGIPTSQRKQSPCLPPPTPSNLLPQRV